MRLVPGTGLEPTQNCSSGGKTLSTFATALGPDEAALRNDTCNLLQIMMLYWSLKAANPSNGKRLALHSGGEPRQQDSLIVLASG